MAITQDYAAVGWLQAFLGVNDPLLQKTRLETKKLVDCIEVICSLTTIREKRDQIESSLETLWDFCHANQMAWALNQVPSLQSDWILPSNDDFTISRTSPVKLSSAAELGAALGIYDWKTNVVMRIRSAEFTTWQRRVARVGSGAPVGFTMATSKTDIMDLNCVASWKANEWADGNWTFQIENQPNMSASVDEAIQVTRPELTEGLSAILNAIDWADRTLRVTKNDKPAAVTTIPIWLPLGDRLVPIHESVYGGKNDLVVTQVFQNVWDSVWPVIYCRRRKLGRGHCELKHIKDKVDQSLSTEPRLFTWLVVFSEMLSQVYTSDGLGICAKYV